MLCTTFRRYLAPELVQCDRGQIQGYDKVRRPASSSSHPLAFLTSPTQCATVVYARALCHRTRCAQAIDMWGIGLLTFIMLFGFNPFARGCQQAIRAPCLLLTRLMSDGTPRALRMALFLCRHERRPSPLPAHRTLSHASQDTHNAILKCEWSFPEGFTVSELARDFISCLLLQRASARLSATEALGHHWLAADKPASPSAILSNDRKPVKALLSEFNAQRMLNKIVKGAHRRLSSDPRER